MCCKEDEESTAGEVNGVTCAFKEYKDRGCTDIIWLIAFIASAGGLVYCMSDALARGADPDLVLKGVDFNGTICENYAAWPSLVPESYLVKICVDDCSETLTDDRMLLPYESYDFTYYCLPLDLASLNASDFAYAADFADALGDIYAVSWVIFASFFIAIASAFVFTILVKPLGLCMVIVGSIVAIGGGYMCAYFLWEEAALTREGGDSTTASYLEGGAITVTVLTTILLLVLLVLRKKIMLGVEVLATAGRAMRDMPLLILFPIVPFIIAVAYIMLWCVIALYLASVSIETEYDLPSEFITPAWSDVPTYVDHEWDSATMEPYFGYVFFHLLWVTQFLVYFNYSVTAGAVCQWYFVKPDENDDKELPTGIITGSCCRTCRFHLGSIALGSFIIACIQFMRACIKYVEEKTKDVQSEAAKCVFKCIGCCLWCLECCLDKLAQNGYVWIAIKGTHFCKGACAAFSLMSNPDNIARTIAIVWVEGVILFIGKFFVSGLTACACGAIITYAYEVTEILIPLTLIFVLALMVAQFFMVEFDVCIDSIFLCLLVDEKVNNGAPQFGVKGLQSMFDKTYKKIATEKGGTGSDQIPMTEKPTKEGDANALVGDD